MSNKDKTRVVADMPDDTSKSFYRKAAPFALAFALALLGILGEYIFRHYRTQEPGAALPVAEGVCKDVPLNRYVGEKDRDGKTCIWRGLTYWCMYDPNKEIWYCEQVAPAPAEKH